MKRVQNFLSDRNNRPATASHDAGLGAIGTTASTFRNVGRSSPNHALTYSRTPSPSFPSSTQPSIDQTTYFQLRPSASAGTLLPAYAPDASGPLGTPNGVQSASNAQFLAPPASVDANTAARSATTRAVHQLGGGNSTDDLRLGQAAETRSVERADLHKSLKSLEAVLASLAEYRDLRVRLCKVEKKLGKDCADLVKHNKTVVASAPSNALLFSANVFDAHHEASSKFVKLLQKEYEALNETCARYFKKVSKEERAHEDLLAVLEGKVKKAQANYESKKGLAGPKALEAHDKYISAMSSSTAEISAAKAGHCAHIGAKSHATSLVLSCTLGGLSDAAFRSQCEGVRRAGPSIGPLASALNFCSSEDMPPASPMELTDDEIGAATRQALIEVQVGEAEQKSKEQALEKIKQDVISGWRHQQHQQQQGAERSAASNRQGQLDRLLPVLDVAGQVKGDPSAGHSDPVTQEQDSQRPKDAGSTSSVNAQAEVDDTSTTTDALASNEDRVFTTGKDQDATHKKYSTQSGQRSPGPWRAASPTNGKDDATRHEDQSQSKPSHADLKSSRLSPAPTTNQNRRSWAAETNRTESLPVAPARPTSFAKAGHSSAGIDLDRSPPSDNEAHVSFGSHSATSSTSRSSASGGSILLRTPEDGEPISSVGVSIPTRVLEEADEEGYHQPTNGGNHSRPSTRRPPMRHASTQPLRTPQHRDSMASVNSYSPRGAQGSYWERNREREATEERERQLERRLRDAESRLKFVEMAGGSGVDHEDHSAKERTYGQEVAPSWSRGSASHSDSHRLCSNSPKVAGNASADARPPPPTAKGNSATSVSRTLSTDSERSFVARMKAKYQAEKQDQHQYQYRHQQPRRTSDVAIAEEVEPRSSGDGRLSSVNPRQQNRGVPKVYGLNVRMSSPDPLHSDVCGCRSCSASRYR